MSSDVPTHYWNNLLALTTKATAESSDQTTPHETQPMDENTREWLETVMSDLVKETDPFKQLESVMNSLHCYTVKSDLSETDLENVEDLMFRLDDLLGIGDLAPMFANKGGVDIVKNFLNSNNASLRLTILQCVMTLTDNNPIAQETVLKSGLLDIFTEKCTDCQLDNKFRLKLLGALSSSVRSYEPAVEHFLNADGPNKLMSSFPESDMAVVAKSIRILTTMAFTMKDNAILHKRFIPYMCQGYEILTSGSKESDNLDEREYTREYLTTCMNDSSLTDNELSDLRKALNL